MTTTNKKTQTNKQTKEKKPIFARSRPATENQTQGT